MEDEYEDNKCYVQKLTVPQAICYDSPLVRDNPPVAPAYHETRLSCAYFPLGYFLLWLRPGCIYPYPSTWRRHQMETYSALLTICAGHSPVPGEFPHKSQWRGALMFSLIYARINGWVNNREAGDLRRYRIHYDVSVIKFVLLALSVRLTQCQWKKSTVDDMCESITIIHR